jgi:hypothetical protein
MLCKVHGALTEASIKKGIYRGKPYRKCLACELARSRAYHKKKYADPEYIKKKHARDKARWEAKKPEIKAKRATPEAKAKRREAYKVLAPRYREKFNATQRVYRETLHDSYIRKMIQDGNKELKFADIPQSLVNFKRTLILARKRMKNFNITTRMENITDESKKCGTNEKLRPRVARATRKKKDRSS